MALKPFWSFPPYFIASFSQNDSVSFSLTAAAPKFCFAITRSDDIWWRRRFAFFLQTPSQLKMALKNLLWNGSGSFFDIYFLKWVLSKFFCKTVLIGNFTDQNQFEQNDSDVFSRHLLFWHSCTFFFDRHWWCCVKNAPIFNQNLSSYWSVSTKMCRNVNALQYFMEQSLFWIISFNFRMQKLVVRWVATCNKDNKC